MPARTAKRLLIVGWDAADWMLINRLFIAGKMPVLRRLVEAGARADLGTLEPKLSPLLWSSIATGKTADKHGILNFVEPKPDGSGLRVSSSTSRKTKALWNVLSQNGFTTHVVGWYASHPAEAIKGSVVTNLLQEAEPASDAAPWPLVAGTVHPVTREQPIAEGRQRVRMFPRETLKALLPKVDEIGMTDDRVQTLIKLMSYATSIERAAVAQLSAPGAWDAAMVFFDAIDTVGHHFMQFVAPKMAHVTEREQRIYGGVMDAVYEWHDAALGRLLQATGPDTTVILLSDHGFHSDHLRPNLSELPPERRMELESSWHRPQGVLVMSGPGIKTGATIVSPTILDVAPTALALVGLPAGEDFDGRVLTEAITCDAPPRIPSWDAVEAVAGETAGLHPADMRQDVFEAADAIKQLVDLGYMAALPEDVQGQLDLVRRESLFNLAVALMSRRRGHEAIPHFERLVAERPSESRYALLLGNCLLGAGRAGEAAACMEALLRHDSKNLDAQLLRAGALAIAGDERGARAQLEPIERAARSRPELALSLGGVLSACGRFADARSYFTQAKARNSRDPAAHIGLARNELALGHFEPAAEHALDALEISQGLPEAHLILGAALAWYGDEENAKKSIGFAIMHDPGLYDAHRWLAVLHAKAGYVAYESDARAEVERLAATMPQGARPKEAPFGPAAFAAKHGIDPV